MSIHAQVANFINSPEPDRFEQLALAVFAHQFDHVDAYRRFCFDRGVSPDGLRSLADIPPVSTAAFKYVAFCTGHARADFYDQWDHSGS